MTEQTDGLTAEQREDEAGLEYTYVSGPEWGTRYSDGTAQEMERLQRENQALREIITKQQIVITRVAEYMKSIGNMLGDWGPK